MDAGAATQADQDKPTVKIHEDFQDGNITLVSNGGYGFRIPDYCLKAHSEVFQNMLSFVQSNDTEIHIPDTHSLSLHLFASGITGQPVARLRWEWASAAIKLCAIYECPMVARAILGASVKSLFVDDIKPALHLAAEYSDLLSAYYILLQGHKSEIGKVNEDSGHEEEEEGYPSTTFTKYALTSPLQWTQSYAETFPKSWVWGLSSAAGKSSAHYKPGEAGQSEEYWSELAGHFLKTMDPPGAASRFNYRQLSM